jgi:hypothetical protein
MTETGTFTPLLGLALTVRFVLELALLVGVGVLAWQIAVPWRWVAVIAGPLAVAVVWGLFLSPKATITLPAGAQFAVEAVLFLVAGTAKSADIEQRLAQHDEYHAGARAFLHDSLRLLTDAHRAYTHSDAGNRRLANQAF